MAIDYTLSTFKIYNKEMQAGMEKALNKNLDVWNQATRGGMILTTESLKGEYEYKALIAALKKATIKKRDPKSVATIIFDTLDERLSLLVLRLTVITLFKRQQIHLLNWLKTLTHHSVQQLVT